MKHYSTLPLATLLLGLPTTLFDSDINRPSILHYRAIW